MHDYGCTLFVCDIALDAFPIKSQNRVTIVTKGLLKGSVFPFIQNFNTFSKECESYVSAEKFQSTIAIDLA